VRKYPVQIPAAGTAVFSVVILGSRPLQAITGRSCPYHSQLTVPVILTYHQMGSKFVDLLVSGIFIILKQPLTLKIEYTCMSAKGKLHLASSLLI